MNGTNGDQSAPVLALCDLPDAPPNTQCGIVAEMAELRAQMAALDDSVRTSIAYAEADRKLIKSYLEDLHDMIGAMQRSRGR